jgi:phage shock protein C
MVPARRLARSTHDKMVLGVCGGIAHTYGWDPTLVRIITLVLLLPLHLILIAAYLILALVMPKDRRM